MRCSVCSCSLCVNLDEEKKNPTKPFAVLCPSSEFADPNITHSMIQLNECREWREVNEWMRIVLRANDKTSEAYTLCMVQEIIGLVSNKFKIVV